MNAEDRSPNSINIALQEIRLLIGGVSAAPCPVLRNMLLARLSHRVADLAEMAAGRRPHPLRLEFTREALARYNGKNGNPAYVAVNGTVFDVTNNAAWAAATHFGMSAGKDLTAQYNACHGGQQVLSKLKAVGKLV